MTIKLGRLCSIGIPTPWAKQINRGDVGEVRFGMWASGDIGEGWLECNGNTFGNKNSGAGARANDDTWELFQMLWTNCTDANLDIYTSSGGSSTRGASALADWTANKRMALPDLRGYAPVHKAASGDLSGLGFSTGDYQHTHVNYGHYHAVDGTGADIAISSSGSHAHEIQRGAAQANSGGSGGIYSIQAGSGTKYDDTQGASHTHVHGDFTGRVGYVSGGKDGDSNQIVEPADSPIFVVYAKIAY